VDAATLRHVARVGGAGVVVVAVHRLRSAHAPVTDRGVADVTGADIATRSAVVLVGLQVDVDRVAMGLVCGNSARGDLNEHERVRRRPRAVADADLLVCLVDLLAIAFLVSLLVGGALMVAVLLGLYGFGPFPTGQPGQDSKRVATSDARRQGTN